MDLHVYESSGDHIYHGNRVSSRGGRLIRDSSGSNAVEIISYNFDNPSSLFNGPVTGGFSYYSVNPSSIFNEEFTCTVVCLSCTQTFTESIHFNLTILQGPNNDWHYYSGDLSSTSYQKTVATFSVATPITTTTTTSRSRFASSISCSPTRTLNESMYISRRKTN